MFHEFAAWLLNHPEIGWVVLLAYLAYELRGKKGRVAQFERKLVSAITVIRALARTDQDIDHTEVDEYLVENGVEPRDFLVDEPDVVAQKLLDDEEDDEEPAD